MTEKLYYLDAYLKELSGRVISGEEIDGKFDVVLDKTAFFPEEGGQYSDTGYINDAEVFKVLEKEGTIHHICDKALEVGDTVECRLNFDERYEKMQIHTGEHILSGLFHSLFGLENVGFHLGCDEVTMDINSYLTEEQIVRVELLANRVIYENVPVLASFPTEDALQKLEYRSKLDLKENVRIVTIGEYDACACCAPHVARSGEVGIIRILDYTKHRGGTRITMTAGIRAVRDARSRYEIIRRVSGLLSVPKTEIDKGTERLISELEAAKLALKEERNARYLSEAEKIGATEGNLVILFENAGFDELKTLANALISRVGGILVLLSGKLGDFKYLIVSKSRNLSEIRDDMNKKLSGRGGGKPEALQGSFSSSLEEIKAYFE
ncbi:MAG: hypothetical protein IJW38_02750 [Clostridia bacterium]|nr:hypothetical protein [Clostridia bacterium]